MLAVGANCVGPDEHLQPRQDNSALTAGDFLGATTLTQQDLSPAAMRFGSQTVFETGFCSPLQQGSMQRSLGQSIAADTGVEANATTTAQASRIRIPSVRRIP